MSKEAARNAKLRMYTLLTISLEQHTIQFSRSVPSSSSSKTEIAKVDKGKNRGNLHNTTMHV